MPTIGSRLDAAGGMGPGFDAIRLFLSFSILFFHSWRASYGETGQPLHLPFVQNVVASLLPLFFALSGFLVAGSALRNADVRRFITLRGLRIMPALTAEITLSALLLGPLVTTLPLWDYFTNPDFYRYFGSLVGKVSTTLPGAFQTNPDPEYVNVSLWTIGPEFLCYAYMAIILLLGVALNRRIMTALILTLVALNIAADVALGRFLSVDGIANPRLLVVCFCLGNLVFLWRRSLPANGAICLACALAGTALIQTVGLVYLAAALLCYAVVYLGLLEIRLPERIRGSDYSYGVYLYSYPVQQTVSHLLPDMREWYVNLAISAPVTFGLAWLSWRLVEKPALTLRRFAPKSGTVIEHGSFKMFLCLSALLCYGLVLIRDYGLPWHRFGATYAMVGPTAVVIAIGIVAAQRIAAAGDRRTGNA